MAHSVQHTRRISHRGELQDSLLSITAHELKNPLTTVKLMTNFLVGCIQKGGKNCAHLINIETITRELERMTGLIDNMVRLRDTGSFMGKLNLAVVSLNRLVHEVIESYSYDANRHKILFTTLSNIHVRADKNSIKQVIINLLSNAVKYSPRGSTVSIKIQRRKDYAIISIKDQGKGIPKEDLIAIFDKHYRVPNQKEKGYGLGLHIVKEIIRNHGGKIWVTSRIGKGSTFYFTLPLLKKGNRKTSSA